MDTYVYEIDGTDYINLTNKCTNSCSFCIRNNSDGMVGKTLWLEKEPASEQVTEILARNKRNVVFCGFGEPMIRIDVLKDVAEYVKSYGGNVRINTNGHANIYHNRNVAKELTGLVDVYSISLNHYNAEEYDKICHSIYGAEGYGYMLDFASECLKTGAKVVLTALDIIGGDAIEKCKKIAIDMGAEFRERFFY